MTTTQQDLSLVHRSTLSHYPTFYLHASLSTCRLHSICLHACMHVNRTHIHTCMHACIPASIINSCTSRRSVYLAVRPPVCLYARMHVCVCLCLFLCLGQGLGLCLSTKLYAYTCTHMCVCLRSSIRMFVSIHVYVCF